RGPRGLGVALGLPVRHRDRHDPDGDDATDPKQAGASVGGVPAAEAGERKRRCGAAYQPADVATNRDVAAPGEGEHEIGDDHAERTPAEDVVALLVQHEARAENPEDRARGADRPTVRAA